MSEMLEYIARHVTEWPKHATSVRVDKAGEICFKGNGCKGDFYPSPRFEGEWVAEGNLIAIGKFYSRDEWEQARSDLLLHTHPQSALDADQYTAGADELQYDPDEVAFDAVNAPGIANKYMREIKPGVWVDVYDVINAWRVTNPAYQHLIKKSLQLGKRGHKTAQEDAQDIIDSALRGKEIEYERIC